jgi:penicillin-binding protein 1A
MGTKLPASAAQANARATDDDSKPSPPPVLTRRGADILVRVEKMLDDATKAMDKAEPGKPVSSTSIGFPDSLASATPNGAPASTLRKN